MSCSLSWKAELSGESKNEVNAREVNTPVSCVIVGVEVGRGGEVESPGAGGDEGGGGGDVEVVMGK